MTPIRTADGLRACLIHSLDKYFIRIYGEDGKFEDMDILTYDLSFTIDDPDAFIYQDEDGNRFIDHSPETLGL